MADRRPCDPDALLRGFFSRELEAERRRPESREPRGTKDEGPAGRAGGSSRPGSASIRRRPWFPELAVAAVLAACAAVCVLDVPATVPAPAETSVLLAERTLALGRAVGAGLARAATGFSRYHAPAAAPVLRIPGMFRGKERP